MWCHAPGSARGVGVLIAIALVLFGCGASEAKPEEEPARGDARGPVGPREIVDGVPRGWRQDGVGAREAAVAYVALSGEVALAGFISRRDLIAAIATPEFAPELEAETAAQLAAMGSDFAEAGASPAQVVWSEMPLTARVRSAGSTAAEVEVWSVVVIGVPSGDAVPRQAWRTVTVELTWSGGDWRVNGWRARPGPTPALGPSPSIALVPETAEVAGWPGAWEVEG